MPSLPFVVINCKQVTPISVKNVIKLKYYIIPLNDYDRLICFDVKAVRWEFIRLVENSEEHQIRQRNCFKIQYCV